MAEKKYYWLKLKSDFFDDETIKFIEEQENGIKYSNFYLKLCLKSLKTEGILIRLIGETLIPYDINSLSKLTLVDADTVRCAMDLFEKIGLVKILDGGEIYLSQINEMIGKETDKAQIMRRKRAENKGLQEHGNNVTKMLPKCYTEIEIEKEIEKDIEIEKENIKEKVQKIHFAEFVTMTNAEYDKLVSTYSKEFADQCITVLDNYKGANGKKYKSDYRAILTWVVDRVKSDNSKKKAQPSGNPFFDILREEGKL